MPKMGNMGHFGTKNQHVLSFLKFVHGTFLKLYWMTDIKVWLKVTVLDFSGKFTMPQITQGYFWAQRNIFGLFSKSTS